MKIKKWITKQQYVDLDTGESITKKEQKQYFRIINKTKHVEIKRILEYEGTGRYTKGEYQRYGIITITNECRRNERIQGTFW